MAHKNGKADGGEGSVGEMRSTLAALPQMSSTFFKNWCLCVCVYEDVCRCLQRPGEGVRSPRVGVTCSGELLHLHAGKCTRVL